MESVEPEAAKDAKDSPVMMCSGLTGRTGSKHLHSAYAYIIPDQAHSLNMPEIAFNSRLLPLKRSPYPMSTGFNPFLKACPKY